MACRRHRRRSGRRRNVRRDVLGVRWHVLWLVSFTDSDTSRLRGTAARIVLFPRHTGLADRTQTGRVGLRAVSRLVRGSGARHEIQCESGSDRARAGARRRNGARTVPLSPLDAWRHTVGGTGGRHRLQLLSAVLLLPGVLVLQPARAHRHRMRTAKRGRIRRFRIMGTGTVPWPSPESSHVSHPDSNNASACAS